MQPVEGDVFETDLGVVKEAMYNAVTPAYASRKTSHWALWCNFCAGHHIDPFLKNLLDNLPYL